MSLLSCGHHCFVMCVDYSILKPVHLQGHLDDEYDDDDIEGCCSRFYRPHIVPEADSSEHADLLTEQFEKYA